MTLSGDYPCDLCKAIAEKKSSEQQKALALDKHDKKFLPPIVLASPRPGLPSSLVYLERTAILHFRGDSPDAPPPRTALS